MRSEPIEPKTRSPRDFAHRAKLDEAIEEPPRGAIGKTGAFRSA
jgi:hypothetical protein